MKIERMLGWPLKRVHLPDGDLLVLQYCKTGDEPDLSLHDINHNVYRLNPQRQIVWQVKRDDSNHPPDWWEVLHRVAREEGHDGAREPFTEFMLEYPDGSNNKTEMETLPLQSEWVPGCKVWLRGSAYQLYVLDPDTGIATNVTKWPMRPW
ncbi:MAG: hypothetical protein QUV35_15130 [Hydrogenophaga sp.]|uniref:hypothetical protein n=1 Tax=Hydrogenophaga sp. TaxID=1904254 RepID=UPI00260D46C2|nr:hypothetical protein [Hydrogenophaga sp.]MDM7943955.1 hypothetical protein [Hydrogenophaga sp.]